VAVTGIRHANAAGEIKEFAPVIRVDVGAFRAVCNKVEDARIGGSHVGKVLGVEGICHGVSFNGNW
jgi:hypothetical protein